MLKLVAASVLLLFSPTFLNVAGWRTFSINLTNATWKSYSNKGDVNATINNNSIDLNFLIKERISYPFSRIEIYFQSLDSSRYDLELMNRTLDICKLFNDPLYEPLVQILYKIMRERGNFMNSCPVEPKLYYVKNMYIDSERFPPYLPERKGYFRLTNFYKNNNNALVLLSDVTTHFRIKNAALNRFGN